MIVMKNKYILLIFLTCVFSGTAAFSQWEKVNTLPGNLSSAYWLDIWALESNPNYIWVCGHNGEVAYTVNGGASWMGTQIPGGPQLETICFPSRTTGYVSGGSKIFKTIDGGANWFDITPQNAFQVQIWGNYFLTEDFGITIGGQCSGTQIFFRTTDGGRTWTEARYYEPNTKLSDVIMYSANGLGYAVSSGFLWKTDNGGVTWEIISWTHGNDWHEDICIKGNSILFPVSLYCDGSQSDPGGARFSTDMGVNWRLFVTPSPTYGSFLHDKMRGWIVGRDEQIYYTSDAGLTWTLRNCGIDPGDHLDDLWFLNDSVGFVVGDGCIYRYSTKVIDKPLVLAQGPTEFCEGDSVKLTTSKLYTTVKWSTGETTRTIVVKQTGWYSYSASNGKCDSGTTDRLYVQVRPKPTGTLRIVGKNPPCIGDTAIIELVEDFPSIQWSNGASGKMIKVTEPGTYAVEIGDDLNCSNIISIDVMFNPLPEPQLTLFGENNFCWGDSVTISTNEGYEKYRWFVDGNYLDGSEDKFKIKVGNPGKYFVEVVDANGCVGISEIADVIVRSDTNKLAIVISEPTDVFDFGKCYYPKQVCRNVEIRNMSWQSVVIDEAYLKRNISFSTPMTQFPILIEPFGTANIKICYLPSEFNEERDTLVLPDLCSPHYMPIRAIGAGAEYDSKSKCETELQYVTIGLNGKYVFSLGLPYPNPAPGIVNIPFNSYQPNESASVYTEECVLYNSMGKIMAHGTENILSIANSQYGKHISGNFSINVEDLPQGIYFASIRTAAGNEYLKIVVSK